MLGGVSGSKRVPETRGKSKLVMTLVSVGNVFWGFDWLQVGAEREPVRKVLWSGTGSVPWV